MSVEDQLSKVKDLLETIKSEVEEIKHEVYYITHQQQNTVAHVGNHTLRWERAVMVKNESKVLKWSGVMSKNEVADSQLTASSHWRNEAACHPRHGRLNGKTGCAAWGAASWSCVCLKRFN